MKIIKQKFKRRIPITGIRIGRILGKETMRNKGTNFQNGKNTPKTITKIIKKRLVKNIGITTKKTKVKF